MNRRRNTRFLTLLLAAALLISLSTSVLAASLQEGGEGAAEAPVVTVAAVGVDKGKYLELGLSVDSRSHSLQSLGAVLGYDPAVLTPVTWTDGAPVDLTGAGDWDSAKPVPAKGPDGFSGKTALTYVEEQRAYLYLSAESPAPDTLKQPLPETTETLEGTGNTIWRTAAESKMPVDQVVTVRFALTSAEGETPEAALERAVKSVKLETEAVAKSSPVGDTSGVIWLGGTQGVATPALMGYVFVESGATVDTGLGGSGPALVVNLAGGKVKQEEETAYSAFLEACQNLAAGESVPVPKVTPEKENYEFAGWTLGEFDQEKGELITYRYDPEAEKQAEIALGDQSAALSALWNATSDGFVSIVFYDWDDTLLGSITVPKGADATQKVKEFVKERSATPDQLGDSLYFDDPNLPFTNKRGYSFDMETYGVWLDYDSETLTHYGSEVQGIMLPKPDTASGAVDLTKVEQNLSLKACYGANEELYTGGLYNTEILSTERVGNTFVATVEAVRENIVDGKTVGVPRLGVPAIRVQVSLGDLTLPLLINVSKKDQLTFQTALDSNVEAYSFNVVETYGDSSWTSEGIKSSNRGDERGEIDNQLLTGDWPGGGVHAYGYLYKATLDCMNLALAQENSETVITSDVLQSMKLDYSMVKVSGRPTEAKRVAQAIENLKAAFATLNRTGVEEYIPLSYEQMQYAIAFEGNLLR